MDFSMILGGVAYDFDATDTILVRVVPISRDGSPFVEFERRGVALSNPDPHLGQACVVSYLGTPVFAGQVARPQLRFDDQLGWMVRYRVMGLRQLGDYVPVTDSNTGLDDAAFNLPLTDLDYIASRAGRNIGQILTSVLTMTDNATRLSALGIGNYTSLTPPTLPAATVSDLAALTTIPPFAVHVQGEKILNALVGVMKPCAPNHTLHVQPDGTLRFLDTRSFTSNALVLDDDPVTLSGLDPDITDCYSRVVCRGGPWVEAFTKGMKPLPGSGLSNNGLTEDFAHDGLTNAAAKTAWRLSDFTNQQSVFGTLSVLTTTSVRLDPTDNTLTWASDAWDQASTGRRGTITLTYNAGSGVTSQVTRRVTANTALTAGGTSDLTLDYPLPITTYDAGELRGTATTGASLVYRKYKITDTAVAAAVANYFPYPVSYRNAAAAAATLTVSKTCAILWSSTGSAPYFSSVLGYSIDPSTGSVIFERPTTTLYGDQSGLLGGAAVTDQEPDDVIIFFPVNTGALTVTSSPDVSGSPVYSGTLHTAYAIDRTLFVTVSAWTDFSNTTAMQTYCGDVLDSVKDVVYEGTVTHYGLYAPAMSPAQAIRLSGYGGFATPWDGLDLPIVEVEYIPGQGKEGYDYLTNIRVSNRRAQYTGAAFLRPALVGFTFGDEAGALEAGSFAAGAAGALGQAAAGLENTAQQAAQFGPGRAA